MKNIFTSLLYPTLIIISILIILSVALKQIAEEPCSDCYEPCNTCYELVLSHYTEDGQAIYKIPFVDVKQSN